MAEIDKNTVQHLADLARIKLSSEELETLTKNLSTILGYVEELKAVPTDGLLEISQVTGLSNVLREDLPAKAGEPGYCDDETRQRLLCAFPTQEKGYLKVKAVFGEEII